MSLVVPNGGEVINLTLFLTSDVSLKLYSNDYTPVASSIASNFTEVAGGGYTAKTLSLGSWTITPGEPSVALYAQQTWTFSGATTAPGTIYGYYVVLASGGDLLWAERFTDVELPFVPALNSVIRITPRLSAQSAS